MSVFTGPALRKLEVGKELTGIIEVAISKVLSFETYVIREMIVDDIGKNFIAVLIKVKKAQIK